MDGFICGEIWSEHLGFNPVSGFRWLIHCQGHWTWVEPVLDDLNARGEEVRYQGREYR